MAGETPGSRARTASRSRAHPSLIARPEAEGEEDRGRRSRPGRARPEPAGGRRATRCARGAFDFSSPADPSRPEVTASNGADPFAFPPRATRKHNVFRGSRALLLRARARTGTRAKMATDSVAARVRLAPRRARRRLRRPRLASRAPNETRAAVNGFTSLPPPPLAQERFAKKNEAEDLRRAFEKLDKKGCVHPRRLRDRPPRPARVVFTHPPHHTRAHLPARHAGTARSTRKSSGRCSRSSSTGSRRYPRSRAHPLFATLRSSLSPPHRRDPRLNPSPRSLLSSSRTSRT